jgi:hypothetical protein
LYLVGPQSMPQPPDDAPLRTLGDIDLHFARPHTTPHWMSEIVSS